MFPSLAAPPTALATLLQESAGKSLPLAPLVVAYLVGAIPLISPPESGFTLLLLTSLAGSLAYVVAADRVRVLRFTVR